MTIQCFADFAKTLRSKTIGRIRRGRLGRVLELHQIRELRRAVETYRPYESKARILRRLLIIPSDPWTLVGSKGDEAMMLAVVGHLRRQFPGLKVAAITATPMAEGAARDLGYVPLSAWLCSMSEAIRKLESFDADAVVVLGADVMDGYYGPVAPVRMLLTAEAQVRRGAHVSILGFSFNQHPNPNMLPVFDGLDERIDINLRDPISLESFRRFSKARSQLVADSAFMLVPDCSDERLSRIDEWAASRRSSGDTVLGFNLHPMLSWGAASGQAGALVESAIAALRQVCAIRPVSLLLISHDYRGSSGDDLCLDPLDRALTAELGPRLMYPREMFTAAQLKMMAGIPDGIITGRMHLAIASLGMERPVAALTYQDKFQGLFGHFEYPERFLLAPAAAADPKQLAAMIVTFVDQLPALAALVRNRLPVVSAASSLNLENLVRQYAEPASEIANSP